MNFKFIPQQYPRYNDVNPEKLAAVMNLTAAQRYKNFVKEITGCREVCGLCQEDRWALAPLEDGTAAFLLWPAAKYAEVFLWPPIGFIEEFGATTEYYDYDGKWGDYVLSELRGFAPRFIELREFMQILLPQLKQNGILPGVFFTPSETGATPTVDELAKAVDDYYDEWYSDEPKVGAWETRKFNAWCREVEPRHR